MKHAILLLFLLPVCLMGETLSYTISNINLEFNKNSNEFTYSPDNDWTYTTAPGSYMLPVKTVNIILPPDAGNITTAYNYGSLKTIKAAVPELNTPYTDGSEILTSKPRLQPTEHVIYQGTGKWGDVKYARFALLPALYDAASGQYSMVENINLSISYSTGKEKLPARQNVPKLLKDDVSFINRNELNNWYRENNYRTYDYLVITTPALYSAAQSLVAYHQSQGMVTSFADINQILVTSAGANPPDKVRNYLINEYISSPFSYLLIIGDVDIVPIAYLTPEPNGNETVPSDFYYSDLSSNFDSDNDGRLGEYDSGMDYTPEIFVGRIPWNDGAIVTQICSRIVNFETSNESWKHDALLPAAILNYADEDPDYDWEPTDGAVFMEYCKSNVLTDYQTTTLYEQAGVQPSLPSDHVLQADTLAALVRNQSYGIVNWSAHGSNTTSARKVWMFDTNGNNHPDPQEILWFSLIDFNTFNNLNNQNGSVYFCASCNNGMLDDPDTCLGEYLLRKKSVANIAATRTGWYKIGWLNPGWGGLSSYNYHFLENYARHGMTVGQAHGYANWLHTQYCLFGDPEDSGGIIWPELQNVYTYLLFGDPAIGYPSQVNQPEGQILIWEPVGNTGNNIVNGLLDLAPFNVVYTNHLIDTYNYLDQFDAVFCLFGLGYGEDVYTLYPDSLEYNYLLSYLTEGGKVYMEGMINWDINDPLFGRFGTWAPFDHVAYIEQLRYSDQGIDQIWDYNGYNEGVPALEAYGTTSQPIFYSYNQQHVNDVIGVWNQVGESRTIGSSFNLGCVYSDVYNYPDFLGVILDTLGVFSSAPVANDDENNSPAVLSISVFPNPFTDHLSLAVKSETPATISVYNIKGQLVRETRLVPQNGRINWHWETSGTDSRALSSGIYLLKVDNGQQSRVIKTLKLH